MAVDRVMVLRLELDARLTLSTAGTGPLLLLVGVVGIRGADGNPSLDATSSNLELTGTNAGESDSPKLDAVTLSSQSSKMESSGAAVVEGSIGC